MTTRRVERLQAIRQYNLALAEDSEYVLGRCNDDIKAFARRKDALLFNQLLKVTGYPGRAEAVNTVSSGCPRVPNFHATDAFPEVPHYATSNISKLLASTNWARPVILGSIAPSKSEEFDLAVWGKAVDEASRGWLAETSVDEGHNAFGDSWTVVRRFWCVTEQGIKTHR